jgi:hypothetical protein
LTTYILSPESWNDDVVTEYQHHKGQDESSFKNIHGNWSFARRELCGKALCTGKTEKATHDGDVEGVVYLQK